MIQSLAFHAIASGRCVICINWIGEQLFEVSVREATGVFQRQNSSCEACLDIPQD